MSETNGGREKERWRYTYTHTHTLTLLVLLLLLLVQSPSLMLVHEEREREVNCFSCCCLLCSKLLAPANVPLTHAAAAVGLIGFTVDDDGSSVDLFLRGCAPCQARSACDRRQRLRRRLLLLLWLRLRARERDKQIHLHELTLLSGTRTRSSCVRSAAERTQAQGCGERWDVFSSLSPSLDSLFRCHCCRATPADCCRRTCCAHSLSVSAPDRVLVCLCAPARLSCTFDVLSMHALSSSLQACLSFPTELPLLLRLRPRARVWVCVCG